MIAAFGTYDLSAICTEIMQKGELQVTGKERDSQLSTQKRDIATIVMQKTINTYTINMIESRKFTLLLNRITAQRNRPWKLSMSFRSAFPSKEPQSSS
ncbi:hypothetical protein MKW92_016493 [Papaver armeniacum]|nr:hypothetical protein MKW92_016493 [Papaver armeniacum]